jgi:hypothetical protein
MESAPAATTTHKRNLDVKGNKMWIKRMEERVFILWSWSQFVDHGHSVDTAMLVEAEIDLVMKLNYYDAGEQGRSVEQFSLSFIRVLDEPLQL